MSRASRLALGVLMTSIVAAATPAFAETLLPTAGGGGGSPYRLQCPAGARFMNGLSISYGAWADSVSAFCFDGVNTFNHTARTGGSGGTTTDNRICLNAGEVVTGILPTSGSFFDGAFLLCMSVQDVRARHTGPESTAPFVGGSGGSARGVFRCPLGEAAIGIYGGSGAFVDRLGLICSPV
jgi:hypothetical protein